LDSRVATRSSPLICRWVDPGSAHAQRAAAQRPHVRNSSCLEIPNTSSSGSHARVSCYSDYDTENQHPVLGYAPESPRALPDPNQQEAPWSRACLGHSHIRDHRSEPSGRTAGLVNRRSVVHLHPVGQRMRCHQR
jgi:hypothetical protein